MGSIACSSVVWEPGNSYMLVPFPHAPCESGFPLPSPPPLFAILLTLAASSLSSLSSSSSCSCSSLCSSLCSSGSCPCTCSSSTSTAFFFVPSIFHTTDWEYCVARVCKSGHNNRRHQSRLCQDASRQRGRRHGHTPKAEDYMLGNREA